MSFCPEEDQPDWSLLPLPALLNVMQHLPQQERVGTPDCCALVCKSWAAAAVEATHVLEYSCCDWDTPDKPYLVTTGANSITLYLHNHGNNLTSMAVTGGTMVGLPCPHLR